MNTTGAGRSRPPITALTSLWIAAVAPDPQNITASCSDAPTAFRMISLASCLHKKNQTIKLNNVAIGQYFSLIYII